MNRLEFMQELDTLLYDISASEKEEALQYYNDYLNDAGVENEQEVLDSLGTPQKVAKTIKEGLSDNGSKGVFTENGFEDAVSYEEVKNEVIKKEGKKESKKQMSTGMTILIVCLCILASPLLIALASAVFGAGLGIITSILGLFLAVGATGIVLFFAALVLIGVGIGELFVVPLVGLCLIGAGLLMGGLSLFCIWLTVWLCGTAIPWTIRGIVAIFSRLFHKKGGERA